jgi:selenide, water dikinase
VAERTQVRLTQYCAAAGCAAKLPPGELEQVLEGISPADAESFESGIGRRDDAGWIEFGGGVLLQSVDFFTPIVDDPRLFGEIAAANALSDIYAMGGEPLTALNLAAFPEELELEILGEILAGGGAKIAESGAVLCGGHSVRDSEPKYGVSVTGFVERERLVRNRGGRPGDALVLTKPLGVGILATAVKRDAIGANEAEDAFGAMARLNRGARDAMQEVGVSAATDVTGFGLLGHLFEMVRSDSLGAVIRRGDVPVWEPAAALAEDGCYPGGLERNRAHLEGEVAADGLADGDLLPLHDPQTSGGLLVAVQADRVDRLTGALRHRGEGAHVIGEITADAGLLVTS